MGEKDKFAQAEGESGYLRYKQQSLVDGKKDHKEWVCPLILLMHRSWAWGMNTAHKPQQLPAVWNKHGELVGEFYRQCWETSQHLMGLFALALGVCACLDIADSSYHGNTFDNVIPRVKNLFLPL